MDTDGKGNSDEYGRFGGYLDVPVGSKGIVGVKGSVQAEY